MCFGSVGSVGAIPSREGTNLTAERGFYGWKLVAVLFSLDFLNMGFPFFGGAVINTYMLKQITMARSTYGLGFTLLNLFIGVPSVMVAAIIVRWGARASFAVGGGFIVLGAAWLSLVASKPWHYLLGYGVIIGTGVCFSTIVPITTVAARWFKRYRGRAMAIPLSASGFAGFVGTPVLNKILTANGGNWRLAWLYVSGIAVVAAIIAALFVRERPEDLGQVPDGEMKQELMSATAQGTALHDWTPSEAYRTRTYWMVLIGGIACQFPYFFSVAHLILHLKSMSLDATKATWALSLLTMGAILGRLIGGWLMDKITPRYAFMMGLCWYLAGSVLAVQVRTSLQPFAYAAGFCHGLAFGWSFVSLNAITARFYGLSAYPKLNGMLLLLTGIACAPAAYFGGWVFDRFGNYTFAFMFNLLLALIGIFALSFATTPQPRREVVI